MVALLLRDQAVASLSQAETKVPAIIICNVILIVASTLGIIVRIFVRVRYIQFGLDDWFCAIGWALTSVECLVCILMTNYGYGRHSDTIHDSKTLVMFLKLDFVTEISNVLALGCIKISFCLFYLKIFPGKWFRITCWSVLAILTGETMADFFVVIFQCSPVYKAWDAAGVVEGKCLQLLSFYYIAFGIRLGTDIALLALPVPKLLKMKVTGGKRAGLIVMFGLGALVTVNSIIRITYLGNLSTDHTWSLVDPLNWSSAELGVGVFIACVPSFKALVTFRFPKLRSIFGLSSGRTHGGRYEMYGNGTTSRWATRPDDPRSWKRSHNHTVMGTGKLGDTQTQTEIEASRNGSEERIISHSPEGIQVTTDVIVDRAENQQLGDSNWPLGR
ncbi:hypothetical protein PMG11_09953 [Penicillium brasilianum]|uniref:Rhodopsin domain-containing protein n=1 Tax=Penicillium brasilianum TaxID=104259 RepID=A0A0F7TXM3_PENBI|nr:hypothetical protein PMG11_09953 [Penicillium brasilianum]